MKIIESFKSLREVKYGVIPPSERELETVMAEPWFKVSDESLQLEGLCFDREGNLYFVEVFGGTIFKLITDEMRLEKIIVLKNLNPAAVKIHKDGRLFVACLGNFENCGGIYAVNPENGSGEWIVKLEKEYVIDDLVFDSEGGFYFTDFKGKSTEPTGGIYYVTPDYKEVKKVIGNMAVPNGIALTPDERGLWVTEMSNNRLHLIELEEDKVSIPPFGTSVPYHFTGFDGPDSCCIDSDGNLYVAIYQQGRVMIFNPSGVPIGQVLIPGREKGQMLRTTHPMLVPQTNDLIICTNSGEAARGSWLFKTKGFAKAHLGFQFQ